MARDPQKLVGKRVRLFINNKRLTGSYEAKVKHVYTGREAEITDITVELHTGAIHKLPVKALTMPNHTTGVIWYGRLIPLSQFLEG